MTKLVAIDGNSLMHRAFYALPPMNNKNGEPTNAVYGFISMLLRLLEDHSPTHLAVALDKKGPTFRHAQFEDYKAGRKETPEDLGSQFALLKNLLRAMNITVLECESFEADDILGALAKICETNQISALLVTGDKDALQLISDHTRVLLTRKGITDTVECTQEWLMQTWQLTPSQVTDLKGLMGDSSDNIPGIPGVGEKTALKLLHEYGSLENVLEHAGQIKGKLGEKIAANTDLARMSKDIATIRQDIPLTISLEDLTFVMPGAEHLRPAFEELSFKSLFERITGQNLGAGQSPKSSQRPSKTIVVEPGQPIQLDITDGSLVALDIGDDLTVAAHEELQLLFPIQKTLLDTGWELPDALHALQNHLGDTPLIVFDSKQLMGQLCSLNIPAFAVGFDIMLASYVFQPAWLGNRKKIFQEIGLQDEGAASLYHLKTILESELRQSNQLPLLYDVEMPLANVLFSMEQEGFAVDFNALSQLSQEYAHEIARVSKEIYSLSGETFNISSPKQLGVVLFEKLGLQAGRKTKTGYSTDIEVLERLLDSHPVIPLIIQYRQLTKLKSTYMDALVELAGTDGRIHSSFNQAITATGRISSTEPNLQNIPVRTEQGREIRRAFIARPGWVLVDADYSQIELRILAHFSDDPTLIDSFRKGEDIHTRTAAEVFSVPQELVTPDMRSSAKAVNFGIVYGISDFGLAKNLGIPRYRAAEYITTYLERYPGVKSYMDEVVEQAKQDGYVSTLSGRRRYIPELHSKNYNIRQFGERVALNMPIQGTAADIIKIAMIRVFRELEQRKLTARLILQVHDELLVEAPKDEADAVAALLQDCMQNVMSLKVPLLADVHQGLNWFETK
ncbi:MAG: DNA polymerase I [Christensenellales bacterium]|jgi:DNA polymerase-1